MGIEKKFGKDDFESDEDFSATKWWPIERQIDAIEISQLIEECYTKIEKRPHATKDNSKLYDDIIELEKYYQVYTGEHYKRPKS